MTNNTKSNFQRNADWLATCGKFPSVDGLSVQIGVHLEEVVELLRTFDVGSYTNDLHDAAATLEAIGTELKRGNLVGRIPRGMRVEALDALCDCEVTGNGIAYLAGFDKDAADQEVLRSNESKLEDGKAVLLDGGKIGKGKHYAPPQLECFV